MSLISKLVSLHQNCCQSYWGFFSECSFYFYLLLFLTEQKTSIKAKLKQHITSITCHYPVCCKWVILGWAIFFGLSLSDCYDLSKQSAKIMSDFLHLPLTPIYLLLSSTSTTAHCHHILHRMLCNDSIKKHDVAEDKILSFLVQK